MTPPALIADHSIDDLVLEFERKYRQSRLGLRRTLEDSRDAGCLLAQIRDRLAHGEWLPWLQEHCEIKKSAAYELIWVAEHWDDLLAQFETAHFQRAGNFTLCCSIRAARRLLTRPRNAKRADHTEPWNPLGAPKTSATLRRMVERILKISSKNAAASLEAINELEQAVACLKARATDGARP